MYVLRSTSTGRLYIGQTADFQRRVAEHQTGSARYTRGRGPWEVILTEERKTRTEAMVREQFLKSGQGREFLRKLLTARS